MIVKSLNDGALITAYIKAKKFYLSSTFLKMLFQEMCDREVKHRLEEIKEGCK